MNVKNIGSNSIGKISDSPTQKARKEDKSQDIKSSQSILVNDKLQISDEGKRMQEIRRRIDSGFYAREDVLKSTSEKIFQKII